MKTEEFHPLLETDRKWQCLFKAFKLVSWRASSEEIIAVAEWLRGNR